MPRIKKSDNDGVNSTRAARTGTRKQRQSEQTDSEQNTSEPIALAVVSREDTSDPSPPTGDEAGSNPAAAADEEGSPLQPETDHEMSHEHDSAHQTRRKEIAKRKNEQNLERWKKLGYYENHPNKKKLRATEAHPTKLVKKRGDLSKVKEKYKLYINPPKKRVMLLQYPNHEHGAHDLPSHQRGSPYRADKRTKPLEIRIKPKSGLVEVDIPLNILETFDKAKGVDYGQALRQSKLLQNGGSYNLAGGLGVGPSKSSRNEDSYMHDGPSREKLLENFDDANNKGHIMNKITMGGRIIPFKDGDPIYMIATFKDSICTFTRLDAMVQLRPQFSHLDALHEQDKSVARYERADEEKATDGKAEDVNMVVKDTEKKKDIDMYGSMAETAKLLRAMRDEPWQHLQWVDRDDVRSYEAYHDNLVYQGPEDAPQLISEMTNEQYLDAISCPRVDPTNMGKKVMKSTDVENESSTDEDDEEGGEEEEAEEEDTRDEANHDSEVSERGREYESLPREAHEPPGPMERDMERICRVICVKPTHKRRQYESLIAQKKGHLPRFAFLNRDNQYHVYFKWRLERNEVGDGIGPEHDYGLAEKV